MTAPALESTQPQVLGDGTTVMLRARTRWQRLRWWLAALVTFLVLVGLSSLLQARTSTTPLAPDNPGPDGARAVAEILRDQGVSVRYVRDVHEARALATAGTTLLVAGTAALDEEQVAALADVAADVVVVDPLPFHLDPLTDGAVTDGPYASRVSEASCGDPDAEAAGEIEAEGLTFDWIDPAVAVCFPPPGPDGPVLGTGAYAVLERDGHRLTLLSDATIMTNARLTEHGHAALVLRALGRHEQLIWLVPTYTPSDEAGTSVAYFPDWVPPVALQLLVVVLAVAIWRGRRLGRVVTEPLPVTVRAAEATLGRGRLYRRARARGHAAAALRAGAASRVAARLGLPRAAGAAAVIDAVTRASRRPTEQVAYLLYGPPPTDDAGLLQLARQLDQLESEVHRT